LFRILDTDSITIIESCFQDAIESYKDLKAARRGLSEFTEDDDSGFLRSQATNHLEYRVSKLHEALNKASEVQLTAAKCMTFLSLHDVHPNFTNDLSRTWSRPSAFELPKSNPINFEHVNVKRIVLFNSFGWRRGEFVSFQVEIPKESNVWFLVTGPNGKYVQSQVRNTSFEFKATLVFRILAENLNVRDNDNFLAI